MESEEYMDGALATEPSPKEFNRGQPLTGKQIRLLHAAMGLVTEAGEVMDQVKRHLFYGAELDEVNLVEEVGDGLWYASVLLDAVGSDFGKAMRDNHNKLARRFGKKWEREKALHRDLDAERQVLEGNTHNGQSRKGQVSP